VRRRDPSGGKLLIHDAFLADTLDGRYRRPLFRCLSR
jgi:hypothetical protein